MSRSKGSPDLSRTRELAEKAEAAADALCPLFRDMGDFINDHTDSDGQWSGNGNGTSTDSDADTRMASPLSSDQLDREEDYIASLEKEMTRAEDLIRRADKHLHEHLHILRSFAECWLEIPEEEKRNSPRTNRQPQGAGPSQNGGPHQNGESHQNE
jgi:hypothetical protein